MSTTDLIINMADPAERRMLWDVLRPLDGMTRVSVGNARPRRSERQNRYYWPCYVVPYGNFLRDQGNAVTDQQAHDDLRRRFLSVTLVRRDTGEIMGDTPRSTSDLTTDEFSVYLEHVAQFLAENCNHVVPPAARPDGRE